MRSVEPFRLRKRMYGLMESGCADDKAAEKNLQVWKSMLKRKTRLDWESEFRPHSVGSDDKRGRHWNKKGKGIRRFSGGGLLQDPQIMSGLNLVLVIRFGRTHPAPTALTRHILRAQITTDHRRRGRRRNTTTRTSGGHNRNEPRPVLRQRLVWRIWIWICLFI